MAAESSEKRGRGRPKGSLNKATVAKQEQMREATTLDVTFESAEDVPPSRVELDETKTPSPRERLEEEEVPVSIVEPEESVSMVEHVAPKPKRKPRKPKVPEVVPELVPEEEETPPPSPVKEMKKRKPRATTVPKDPEPVLTYLQVLQRGLAAAKATQKAEKVQRYDAYFSHL